MNIQEALNSEKDLNTVFVDKNLEVHDKNFLSKIVVWFKNLYSDQYKIATVAEKIKAGDCKATNKEQAENLAKLETRFLKQNSNKKEIKDAFDRAIGDIQTIRTKIFE